MAKRFITKALSAGLSLTLCAALVVPSFAAVALNKNLHIDSGTGALKQNEEGTYDYYLDQDIELDKTLLIKDGVEASIDLKGHNWKQTGDYGSGPVISVKDGGKLELDDTTAQTDEDGNYVAGSISGGSSWNQGGGVFVGKDSEFVLNGGIISDNVSYWGGGINNEGTVTMNGGQVSGNEALKGSFGDGFGGGIYNKGTMTMNGGQIVDNSSQNVGAGVFNANSFTMKGDAAIVGNVAGWDGGGVYNSGDFVMENGKINNNTSGCDGGGMHMYGGWNAVVPEGGATFTMNGGEIADNDAASGGGGISVEFGDLIMNGGAIIRNEADKETYGVANYSGKDDAIQINYDNVTICNYGKDGVAETRHEFTNGAVEDAGADGHKITKECAHGCGTTDIIMEAHAYGAWQTVTAAQVGVAGVRKHTCTVCGHEETGVIPALTDQVEIDDPEVPLAGLFTRGDAIGYLWEQAGSPEAELSTFPDVPEDHQWAVAIGWAEDMGIALPDLEGNFRPDDLVLRSVEGLEVSPEGELQEFLNRYAAYAGIELAEEELFIELAGAWDDVIMGEEAQEIFDGFFTQLEAALAQAA